MQGTASALNGTNASGAGQTTSTLIAIKQESLSTVDNLVGSYVDSTTFLPSPNNQVANLVQNHILATNEASGVNEGKAWQVEEGCKKSKIEIFQVVNNKLKSFSQRTTAHVIRRNGVKTTPCERFLVVHNFFICQNLFFFNLIFQDNFILLRSHEKSF